MQGWRRLLVRCTVVGLVWCGWSGAPVWAETINCTAITAVPFTITTEGIYCVTQDIETNMTAGNAIDINTNNVVLDLNGHTLGNLTAGPGTTAIGIHALNLRNLTIKNGTVQGFLQGIFLEDAGNASGQIIEDIRADLTTFTGIQLAGTGNIIRNNLVLGTGGTTTLGANADVFGIVVDGAGNQILNNDVVNTVAVGTGVTTAAIYVGSGSAVVDYNRVSNAALPGSGASNGIFIASDSVDVLVVDNRIITMTNGIAFVGTGKYGRNLTSGVTTRFSGGTASTGNND